MTEINENENAYTPKFSILYEDNHIIVVLKPQMTACCPDESKDDNLFDQIKEYIKITYNKQGNVYLGLVHRLDRPTGGVMVYAKTSKAAARLTAGLQAGDFEKKYLTVLCGTPDDERGTLCNYLRKNTVNNMVYICTPSEEGAKYAELDYKVMESKGKYSLVEAFFILSLALPGWIETPFILTRQEAALKFSYSNSPSSPPSTVYA